MAQQHLKILIAGAGIAGLCAAIGLAKQGHEVVLLEGAHRLSPVGAGIHVPPNATLVLEHWNILEKFRDVAITPSGFVFRRYQDSSVLAQPKPRSPAVAPATPYWSMKRSDYQQGLYEVALEAGVEILLGKKIVAMDEDEPSLTTSEGEKFVGDMVIVADGMRRTVPIGMLKLIPSRYQVPSASTDDTNRRCLAYSSAAINISSNGNT